MRLSPRQLFLLDGVGALVSALSLGLVLTRYQELIGMPLSTLRGLSVVACVFATYSLTCATLAPVRWDRFLAGIGIANLSYCAATVLLLYVYSERLQPLGWGYFVAELAIVVPLAVFELSVARGKGR